jgi:serine/threonine protein kinase
MMENPPQSDATRLSVKKRHDQVCDEFEADLAAGKRCTVEYYLQQVPESDRSALLDNLARLVDSLCRGPAKNPFLEGAASWFDQQLDALPFEFTGKSSRHEFAARSEQPTEKLVSSCADNVGVSPPALPETDFIPPAHSPSRQFDLKTPASLPCGRPFPVIDGYDVLELVGKGGFAWVFRGRDRTLGREVAIKIPRLDRLLPPPDLQGLLDEARQAARLKKHANIVQIYDAKELGDGTCAIIMEYVGGRSLLDEMQAAANLKQRFSPRRAATILSQVAKAVHFVHKQDLYHRDLKPANILLDDEGSPHVADFGLALPEETKHEHAEEVAGTRACMAPEQVLGKADALDGRCDVWALGVILYELLAGRTPFCGNPSRLRKEILQNEPRPLRQFDDTMPHQLDEICRRCLRKDVSDRYGTALDVAHDLDAWLRQDAATTRPSNSRARGITFVGLMVLVGAIVIALILPRFDRERPPPDDPYPPGYEQFRDLSDAPRDKWISLLDRSPLRFRWIESADSSWTYRQEQETLTTTCRSLGLFGVARSNAASFRLEVSLKKPNPAGSAGILLGAIPINDGLQWQLQTVFVQTDDESGTSIRRQKLLLDADDMQVHSVEEFAEENVGAFGAREHRLQVVVWGNHVREVTWDGTKLPALSDELSDGVAVREDAAKCLGVFGVMNLYGSTTFSDVRYRREQ